MKIENIKERKKNSRLKIIISEQQMKNLVGNILLEQDNKTFKPFYLVKVDKNKK